MENTTLIAVTVSIVARDFLSLAQELSSNDHFTEQVPAIAIEDEFSRFKIWAGNVAAHRRGRRSLEYRLRDAERLRLEVHSSLKELDEIIHDSIAIVKGEKIPWEMEQLDSDSDSDSGSSGTPTDSEDDTELKQLLSSIKTSITGLFRLSMAIRNPAPTSQIESSIMVDKSIYQEFDVQHVQAKFPECVDFLTKRLGRAISARRQYLTYREEHHKKLVKDIEKIGLEDSKTEHTTNSTEATPIPAVERRNSLNVLAEDDSASQTSFATSINAAIRIPSLPKQAREQDYFECPLCFMIISVDTKHAWKQHVYRDLHPYCCTFENCTTAGRLFDSRHEWFNHELAHRRFWECIEECGQTFHELAEYEKHIHKRHVDLIALLPAMRSTSARGASLSSQAECSFCKTKMTLKRLQKHVASHQQQLALFALPPNLDETEEDDEEEETSTQDAGNHEDDEESYASDTEDVEEPTETDVILDRFLAIESATRKLNITVASCIALEAPARQARLLEATKVAEDLRDQIDALYSKINSRETEASKSTLLQTKLTQLRIKLSGLKHQLDDIFNLLKSEFNKESKSEQEMQTGKHTDQEGGRDGWASTNAASVQDPGTPEVQDLAAKEQESPTQPQDQRVGGLADNGTRPRDDRLEDNLDMSSTQEQHNREPTKLNQKVVHGAGIEMHLKLNRDMEVNRDLENWFKMNSEDLYSRGIAFSRREDDGDRQDQSTDDSDIPPQSTELAQPVGDDPITTDPQSNIYNSPIPERRSEPTDAFNGTSSAFSEPANPEEDWTKISDEAERRRVQNRIAQRNYPKSQGAYAGPTFHASPAPSALPIPKFLSKSVPAKTRPGPQLEDLEHRQTNTDNDQPTPAGPTPQIVESEERLSRNDHGSTEQGPHENYSEGGGSMAAQDKGILENDRTLLGGLEALHESLSDRQSKIQDELVRMKHIESVEMGKRCATSPEEDEVSTPARRKQWQKVMGDAESETKERDDCLLHVVGRADESRKEHDIEEEGEKNTEPMKDYYERKVTWQVNDSLVRRAEEEEKKAKRKAEEEELERVMRERLIAFGFQENQIQGLIDGKGNGEGPDGEIKEEAMKERERIIHENERRNLLDNDTARNQAEESGLQLDAHQETKPGNEEQGHGKFLEKQKASETVKISKRKAEEEELEQQMLQQLAEASFRDKGARAPIEPGQGASGMKSLATAPQPTYAKIHRKHLEVETLHYYNIPYEYDSDPSYIIVLRELSERETDILFEHTRRIRQRLAFPDSRPRPSRPEHAPVRGQELHQVEATPSDRADQLDKPTLRRRTRSQGDEPRPNVKTYFY